MQRLEAAAADEAAKDARAKGKKKKDKGSFADNFVVLKSSAKIRNLALLVMSYGVAHRRAGVWGTWVLQLPGDLRQRGHRSCCLLLFFSPYSNTPYAQLADC